MCMCVCVSLSLALSASTYMLTRCVKGSVGHVGVWTS